jgi:small subunit ribosomal protein S20
MAAGAIPPPLFFGWRRPCERKFCEHESCDMTTVSRLAPAAPFLRDVFEKPAASITCLMAAGALTLRLPSGRCRRIFETMANTTSAKKATRKIARRTVINKSRRTQMRGAVRNVEEAIKRGDREAALKAMVQAEPELMQAAQCRIIHKNNASRKVSRLTHQIAKLAK